MNHLQKLCQNFETCVLVNDNLCGKLFSSFDSPAKFDEISKVASPPLFIPDFNLLSCEFDNLRLNFYIESSYIKVKIKIRILLQFVVKNLKLFLSLLQ